MCSVFKKSKQAGVAKNGPQRLFGWPNNPCFNVLGPCFNIFDPCFNVFDPCFNVFDPCFNVFDPCFNDFDILTRRHFPLENRIFGHLRLFELIFGRPTYFDNICGPKKVGHP